MHVFPLIVLFDRRTSHSHDRTGVCILPATSVIALWNRVFRTHFAYLLCPIPLHISIRHGELLEWWGSDPRRQEILLLLILHQFFDRILPCRHLSVIYLGWGRWLCTKFVLVLILSSDRPPPLFMSFDIREHLFRLCYIAGSDTATAPFKGGGGGDIRQGGVRYVLVLVHGIHELLSSPARTSRP